MRDEKGCPGGCGEIREGCGSSEDSEDDAGAERRGEGAQATSPEPCPVLASRKSRQEGSLAGGHGREMEKAATSGLEGDLLSETLKWQGRAEDLFSRVSGEAEFLENISAYIADSRYFLEKNDLIRAFEAVIWAWAWMEIGLLKGILQERR